MRRVAEHNVFREGKVHVMRKECLTCVFKPHERPVSGARVAEMVKDTLKVDGSTIVCHHTLMESETGGQQRNAICRGWYDRLGDTDVIIRLARVMDVIEEQDEESK